MVTYQRKPILIEKIDLLRESFKNSKQFFNFEIFGVCVLPDHVHLILRPENTNEYPKIITSIKYYFSHRFNDVGVETPTYRNQSNLQTKQNPTYGYKNKFEKGIWQRRYWEHTIKSDEDLYKHLDYIHYNPVKHGLTKNVKDWEYSSFFKFVEMKNYDLDWGSTDQIKHIATLDYD